MVVNRGERTNRPVGNSVTEVELISRLNPEDFHFASAPTGDQWKWWRHFKLQAKMLSELIIRRDSVYTSWLTYLHLHCTKLCTTNITTSQLELSVNLIPHRLQFFYSNWLTDCIVHWVERGEILDGGDREEREDGEEISFLDKLWSESEHEEGSAESWYQHWYTPSEAKDIQWTFANLFYHRWSCVYLSLNKTFFFH